MNAGECPPIRSTGLHGGPLSSSACAVRSLGIPRESHQASHEVYRRAYDGVSLQDPHPMWHTATASHMSNSEG
jgi:hypothetical protein